MTNQERNQKMVALLSEIYDTPSICVVAATKGGAPPVYGLTTRLDAEPWEMAAMLGVVLLAVKRSIATATEAMTPEGAARFRAAVNAQADSEESLQRLPHPQIEEYDHKSELN